MKRITAILGLFAAQLAVSASPSNAPSPKLLREIDLPAFMRVGTLAFSPDEHWIAVIGGGHRSELLLLPLDGSPEQTIHIDSGMPIFWGPEWSPNSGAVVGASAAHKQGLAKLYSVRGNQLWEHVNTGQTIWDADGGVFAFLDPGPLLARQISDKGKPAGFETLDLQGQVIDTWPEQKQWQVAAINPDRHLVAVFPDRSLSKTLIIDYPSKRVIQTKSNPTWLYEGGGRSQGVLEYFVEAGKTICTVGSAESRAVDAECRDVDSGQKIAEFHRFTGGWPAAASDHASRLVLTQETRFWSKRRSQIDSYGERVVWDFRAGTEIAAWGVRGQSSGASSIIQPSPVAISPTGRYLAEGADGILRIYELP
jgi:WD40 repeat protein